MGFWDIFRSTRKEDLRLVANRLKMEYSPSDDWGTLSLLKDFKLFKIGGRKKIRHLMISGIDYNNTRTSIFDYHFTISTGKSSHTYKQTVFFVQSKDLGLPQFYMRPEVFLDKAARLLGKEDIDFVSHEIFSDKYHLTGSDESLIRSTFTPDVLHHFTFNHGWSLEGLNYFLIIYRKKHLMPPDEIKSFYQMCQKVLEMLKEGGFQV